MPLIKIAYRENKFISKEKSKGDEFYDPIVKQIKKYRITLEHLHHGKCLDGGVHH